MSLRWSGQAPRDRDFDRAVRWHASRRMPRQTKADWPVRLLLVVAVFTLGATIWPGWLVR